MAGGGRAKRGEGEGITQAAGTARHGPGRLPALALAAPAPVALPVDKRTPVLSFACLARMLDAVSNDGLVSADSVAAGAPNGNSAHTQARACAACFSGQRAGGRVPG